MENIPNEVTEYVYSFMEDYEYSDNVRIAEKNNKESEEKYLEIADRGCCGSVDYQMYPSLVNGKQYYFGFNYGH